RCFKEGSVLKWQVVLKNHLGLVFRKICCSYALVNWDVEPLSTSSCITSYPGQIRGNLNLSHSVDLRMKLYVGRRSSFTHNRYLEEVEKYIKPGFVTEKKTYCEELFRRRALLSQSSSDCQDGADSQATTLLENGKYQASENEGYAGCFEHVNEVGHFARFDENYDSSTRLSKNEKYQAENRGYDGDSERVNEVDDSSRFEESFGGSNNGDIKVTECGREGSSNRDIEVTECGGEDSISCHSGPRLNKIPIVSMFFRVFLNVWKLKKNLISVLEIHLLMIQSTEEQPIARKVIASHASCTEKVSHRLYQSVNRDKESVKSCQSDVKQNESSFCFKTEERARKRKEIEEKVHAKEEETRQLQARTQ
ncbi:protein WVD2-like 7, partial [Capsicum annuum]|uniref:protein WVD2-like 7 n=1 Tax=Capsicum annuum TaxID=4072 RepID=UPI001FB13B2F